MQSLFKIPNVPTPTIATLRAAFIADGLSVTDTGDNEWIEMQETVAGCIWHAAKEAGIALGADDTDQVYEWADSIVGRLDYHGEVR